MTCYDWTGSHSRSKAPLHFFSRTCDLSRKTCHHKPPQACGSRTNLFRDYHALGILSVIHLGILRRIPASALFPHVINHTVINQSVPISECSADLISCRVFDFFFFFFLILIYGIFPLKIFWLKSVFRPRASRADPGMVISES